MESTKGKRICALASSLSVSSLKNGQIIIRLKIPHEKSHHFREVVGELNINRIFRSTFEWRVVSGIDIKANSASIFQALRKCPIVTADIFLFNIGKSMKKFDQINYDDERW